MIILDHNIPEDQAQQLRGRRIHFRQIGVEVGRPEWDDQQEILRFLHSSKQLTFWLFRVFCEGVFTTEAPSSQRSENFLIKNSLLRVLRAFAVQSPSPTSQECLKSQRFLRAI